MTTFKKFLHVLFFVMPLVLTAQQKKPLMVVNGEQVSAEEFMAVFMKNNLNKKVTRADLEEYLQLYLNYRLKLLEAKRLGLDTIESLRKELEGYRKILAQPYLTKTAILDRLVEQAWERMQWDLRVSHILVKVSPYASPADTLKAYRRALSLRQQVLQGEPFEKVAYEKSDDEFARGTQGDRPTQGNYGDLGYFSALDMIYPFENAAYSLKVGEISMPIRTEFGYHVIKLTDKRPALGKVQTAHILIAVKPDASEQEKQDAYNRAMDIYNRIMAGESFETLAQQYSDDKGSGRRGGVLPWFGPFRMLPQFIEPLYDMKPGDISKPILTMYGYHIIKLIDRKPPGNFEEVKGELKSRIMRDVRYRQAIEAFVMDAKKQRNFKEYPKALQELIQAISNDIYEGTWKAESVKHLQKPLFSIGDRTHTQYEFAQYLENQGINTLQKSDNKEIFVHSKYTLYVNEMVMAYENDHLEETRPEFGALMKEYFDGILLFELTDRMVWKRAMQDTAGLRAFYEQIKHQYMQPEKVEATLIFLNNSKDAEKLYKALKKKTSYNAEVIDLVAKKTKVTIVDRQSAMYVKDENPVFVDLSNSGVYAPRKQDDLYVIVIIHQIIPPSPKPLHEIRGIVTSEYQNYLEREWMKELRQRYSWQIHDDVFETLVPHE